MALSKQYVIAALIFLFTFALYFYTLGTIPNGLNQDETAIGYNAYSILQTGKDEHGVTYPLYFKSFNDYKLPGYIYLTALSIKIFGLNAFAVRFPSAFFGLLTVVALFFLIRLIAKNTFFATAAAIFLAINPWHFFFSRVGFEVNVAVSFIVFGMLLFYLALNNKNNLMLFLLSILAFCFSIYTYNVTRLIAPLIFFILIFCNHKTIRSISSARKIALLLFFFVGMIPFLLTFSSGSGFGNQTNVLLLGGDTQAGIIEFKSYVISLPKIFTVIFFNKWILLFWEYAKNLIASFSPNLYFVSSGDMGNIGVGNVGLFYLYDCPLLIYGVYTAVKQKITYLYPFIFWIMFSTIIVSLSAQVPNGTRSYNLVIPFIIFSAFGACTFWQKLQHLHKSKRLVISVLSALFVLYAVVYFYTSYFTQFPVVYRSWWRSQEKPLALYLQQQEPHYNKIIIDSDAPVIYTSILFYQAYPPQQYLQTSIYQPDSLFTNVKSFGKYEIRKINWSKDLQEPNTLFVAAANNGPQNKTPIKTFAYPPRPVVISVEGKIAQYPTTETLYNIYSSDQ